MERSPLCVRLTIDGSEYSSTRFATRACYVWLQTIIGAVSPTLDDRNVILLSVCSKLFLLLQALYELLRESGFRNGVCTEL
jgi:hypothetical protein